MAPNKPPGELPFNTLCQLFDRLREVKGRHDVKKGVLERFIAKLVDRQSGAAFDLFRLALPGLDQERGNYQLREDRLASVLIAAVGLARDSNPAKALLHWKRVAGGSAGDLAAVAEDNVFNDFCAVVPKTEEAKQVKIREVNQKLDELAAGAGAAAAQAGVLRWFLTRCTARQMYWLTKIVLKATRIGTNEGPFFRAWHDDAQLRYDATMSLRAVRAAHRIMLLSASCSLRPALCAILPPPPPPPPPHALRPLPAACAAAPWRPAGPLIDHTAGGVAAGVQRHDRHRQALARRHPGALLFRFPTAACTASSREHTPPPRPRPPATPPALRLPLPLPLPPLPASPPPPFRLSPPLFLPFRARCSPATRSARSWPSPPTTPSTPSSAWSTPRGTPARGSRAPSCWKPSSTGSASR
jgi:hypothetical protein